MGPLSSVRIRGGGLAGVVLGRALERLGLSIQIYDYPRPGAASAAAAGIWLPVSLFRLVPGWRVAEAIPAMKAFMQEEEQRLGLELLHPMPYLVPLCRAEQELQWSGAAAKHPAWLQGPLTGPELTDRLTDRTSPVQESVGDATVHWEARSWGVVLESGWFDVQAYLEACRMDWTQRECWHVLSSEEEFAVSESFEEEVTVDARGYWSCRPGLPMKPAQGELVEFTLHGWPQNVMLKKELFLQPLGKGRFRAGSTFEWQRLSPVPTPEGRAQLVQGLRSMLGPWWPQVQDLEFRAGIRPASHDRRPYVGRYPAGASTWMFNGFGAKGVLLAPLMAAELALHLVSGPSQAGTGVLNEEADTARLKGSFPVAGGSPT